MNLPIIYAWQSKSFTYFMDGLNMKLSKETRYTYRIFMRGTSLKAATSVTRWEVTFKLAPYFPRPGSVVRKS
jgi:hypothetical protein